MNDRRFVEIDTSGEGPKKFALVTTEIHEGKSVYLACFELKEEGALPCFSDNITDACLMPRDKAESLAALLRRYTSGPVEEHPLLVVDMDAVLTSGMVN